MSRFPLSLAVPALLSVHLLFEYTAHIQTGVDFEWSVLFKYPILALIYLPTLWLLQRSQVLLFISSVICSIAMLHFVDKGTFGDLQKAPGLAVLWIHAIICLDLTFAVIALIPPAYFYYFHKQTMFI
jgi:hypothetical protein